MSEIKLKKCPFCGGEAEMGFRDASAFVMCTKCLARSRTVVACVDYTAREVAADEWNQRTDQPPKARWTREDVTSYDGETIKNGAAVCGRCKKAFFMPTDTFDYCPNCGARMDLIETDDDLLRLIQKKTEGEK